MNGKILDKLNADSKSTVGHAFATGSSGITTVDQAMVTGSGRGWVSSIVSDVSVSSEVDVLGLGLGFNLNSSKNEIISVIHKFTCSL